MPEYILSTGEKLPVNADASEFAFEAVNVMGCEVGSLKQRATRLEDVVPEILRTADDVMRFIRRRYLQLPKEAGSENDALSVRANDSFARYGFALFGGERGQGKRDYFRETFVVNLLLHADGLRPDLKILNGSRSEWEEEAARLNANYAGNAYEQLEALEALFVRG